MRDDRSADDDVIGTRHIRGRAEPLPEEVAAEQGGEDWPAAATEVLRDSEERVTAASEADAPGDATVENRTSDGVTDS